MDIEYRKMYKSDLSEIASVIKATFDKVYGKASNAKYLRFANHLWKTNIKPLCFVAFNQNDKKIVGYIFVKKNEVWWGPKTAEVSSIAILPQYWRKGIAKRLMARGFEAAKKQGFAYIALDVWVENKKAQAFYKKMGFKKIEFWLKRKL